MKFCCQFMENMLTNAGSKGFSFIITKPDERFVVKLLFRSSRPDELAKLRSVFQKLPPEELSNLEPMEVESKVVVKFCPQCGYSFEKWFAKNKEKAEELVEKHANI